MVFIDYTNKLVNIDGITKRDCRNQRNGKQLKSNHSSNEKNVNKYSFLIFNNSVLQDT